MVLVGLVQGLGFNMTTHRNTWSAFWSMMSYPFWTLIYFAFGRSRGLETDSDSNKMGMGQDPGTLVNPEHCWSIDVLPK